MIHPTIDHDPFEDTGGMGAYRRAMARYTGATALDLSASDPLWVDPAPAAPGTAYRNLSALAPLGTVSSESALAPLGTASSESALAPLKTPSSESALAPLRTSGRPVLRADGTIDPAGLWDRGRLALRLRGADARARAPWIESPEPELESDFKLFPIKRRAFTGTFAERIARWLRVLPGDFAPVIDDFGRDAGYEAAVAAFFDLLYRRWFRVETFGMDHVPAEGRALLASNHADWMIMDAAMIAVATRNYHPARRQLRALVDRFAANLPWWSIFLARTGQVLGCPENTLKLLEREELVLVFPEGSRGATKPFRERHRLAKFGSGFARMAILTKTPIIPVAVEGFEELHPVIANPTGLARRFGLPHFPITPTFPWLGPLGLVPPPVKCFIEFGRPILTEGYADGAAEDEEAVLRLSEKVRFIVQDLYQHLRARRRSLIGG